MEPNLIAFNPKSCPFCGGGFSLTPTIDHRYYVGHKKNCDCPLREFTTPTIEKALQLLNLRARDCVTAKYFALIDVLIDGVPVRTEKTGDIILASDYWECGCNNDFVHKKSEDSSCADCGFTIDDGADARLNDVLIKFGG